MKKLTLLAFLVACVAFASKPSSAAETSENERNESAKQVAKAWLSSWFLGETAVTTSLSAVPFSMDGKRKIETVEELRTTFDAFVKREEDLIEKYQKTGIEFKLIEVNESSAESVVVRITIPDDDEGGTDDETIEVHVRPGHAPYVVGFRD